MAVDIVELVLVKANFAAARAMELVSRVLRHALPVKGKVTLIAPYVVALALVRSATVRATRRIDGYL